MAHQELTLDVPCDQEAPAAARELLRELDGDRLVVSDAMLVASELVTNAVRHSGAGEHDLLTVGIRVSGDHLTITVADPGRSGTTARQQPGADGLGGFGLRLVDKIAERWGSERADRHRVWAELALGRWPARL